MLQTVISGKLNIILAARHAGMGPVPRAGINVSLRTNFYVPAVRGTATNHGPE